MKKIALAGLGPHAKRIYLKYFKKHHIDLALVIELVSKKSETIKYLDENGFKNTKIFFLEDTFKDNYHLPEKSKNDLIAICRNLEISHFFISTEPKAHFMYLEFCLKNDINVLTDKPITVTKDMTNLKSVELVRSQYYELLKLAKHSKGSCKIMCQRQYHRGYEKIKEILENIVTNYKVPITNIEIFYSDGAWEMPHDLNKENHPYKYGYGELFHSGYHFIDFLSDLLKINDSLGGNKKITHGDVYSKVFTPNDEMHTMTIEDYKRLFKSQTIPDYYAQNENPTFSKYGEKDYHGLFTFYNRYGFTITTANLNLLHNSISRRAWIETRDFYKSNGRIRHERIDIQVGHLLNIQVHSYQSKEISERTEHEESVGGLEHFDIYFFHNPLIDKEPFKEIHLGDLFTQKEKKNMLGYNELARATFITNFLKDNRCRGDISDQALAIEMLYSCAKGTHNKYANKKKVENINMRNDYTYRFIAKRLKNYSRPYKIDLEKDDIKNSIHYNGIYTIYNFLRYIPKEKLYEVFISLDDTKNVAGSLLNRTFKNKIIAYSYYNILEFIIAKRNIYTLEKMIEH